MYSASHVDVDTVTCLLEFHEIAPLPSEKTNPEVDRRVSKHPTKSASVQPVSVMGFAPPENKPGVACSQ